MRSVEFDPGAFDDLAWWAEQDRTQAIRIIRLVGDTQRDPVYQVLPDKIRILACRYHY